ncbi:MAG: DNA cytosine methyltransferase [Ruminococcus sp.]|nr:MAG: DNA cytosine methyltransferase [Ruminococcus sp.]
MHVLSLFDGISCGMVALERSGILVEKYHAYEIDKYATAISKKEIIPKLIITVMFFYGNFRKYKNCDLLIGGSPCTYWSVAKKRKRNNC